MSGASRHGRFARLSIVLFGLAAVPAASAPKGASAEDLVVVDCLLPGQIRQLGPSSRYVSARRPVKTTAFDCRVRSGEYVVEDRASLATALRVWLDAANAGDLEAQTTVGEIFERGLGVPPDYAAAASWFRRAAEAGYSRAQINLGTLYERGLGVAADPVAALSWYRRAAGLDAGIALDTVPDVAPVRAAEAAERKRLEAELARLGAETENLRAELATARERADWAERASLPASPLEDAPAAPEPPRAEEDALRRAIAAREHDIETLNAALAATRSELEAALAEAARTADAAAAGAQSTAAAQAAAAAAQAESEARRADLAHALGLLAERERALGESAQTLATLQARLGALERREREVDVAPRAMATGLVAGPEISLIDPVLPRTRGLVKVSVPATLDRRRIVGRVTAPAGLLSVSVNDVPTEVNAAGVFTAEVIVPAAEARVAVSAIDNQGKRSDVAFVLAPAAAAAEVVAATVAAKLPAVEFGRYHALLIGNERYRHLPALHTPGADVEVLERLLRERFGFETRVVRDATRYEILSALNEARARLTTADNLLVYYAGHGELDEVNMRGHWLPVDAEPNSSANWISNVTITDILNVIPAKQVLLVADSCYSGTLTRSSIAAQETTLTEAERLTWLKLMAGKRARVVLTSGGLAPVLDSGGGRHSVFARALIETLESIADVTEGQALYRAVAARVAHAASRFEFEQTPQFAPIAHAGHESGDFFLLPRR